MYNDENNYTAYNSEPQPQPQPQPQLTKKGLRAMRKAQRIERRASQPKKKNWFVRGVAMVVCAVLLGGVAGVACYGVSYAGYSLFPIKNSSQTDALAKPATTAAQLGNVNANKDITATVYDVSDIVDSVYRQ